ncbi:MAG TPA: hypothetical protein VIJ82_26550 [Streptosporangiaceae bacterium]|jgi:hypothetical protein
MTQSFEEDIAAAGTETVPDGMAAEFSSLTTPYCWVVTEDLVAGYDGAEPSAVGKFGPPDAVAADVFEALSTGRWFRLSAADGALAVGRIYDPSGDNERAPLDDLEQPTWGATVIDYRQGGQWEAL